MYIYYIIVISHEHIFCELKQQGSSPLLEKLREAGAANGPSGRRGDQARNMVNLRVFISEYIVMPCDTIGVCL